MAHIGTRLMLASLVAVLTSCATITVRPDGGTGKITTEADYSKSESFYLFGLIGHHDVDIQRICPQGASQMKVEDTFLDRILRIITINIYTPRSIKVWCRK